MGFDEFLLVEDMTSRGAAEPRGARVGRQADSRRRFMAAWHGSGPRPVVLRDEESAPSERLRQWFHGPSDRWHEFGTCHQAKLVAHRDSIREIAGYSCEGAVIFLYASKNEKHNNTFVLRD